MMILVVEDDLRVANFLERGLRAEGHQVQMARTGPEGLEAARQLWQTVRSGGDAAVVLLDLMLPGASGLEICQTLRAEACALPILMLTAMDTPGERVTGLRAGADDYLGKPFAFEELLARIDALARRSRDFRPQAPRRLQVADLVLDRETMRVTRGGQPISLTARELALLELLMSAPGRLFSRERILANVWGTHEDPLTNVVDVYISRLRSKIDGAGGEPLIHTSRGLGYRLDVRG
jgi:DNA-binding response OmpR family regulator